MIFLIVYSKNLHVQYCHIKKSLKVVQYLHLLDIRVPVIASDISGVREYLTNEHDSLLFQKNNHASLIDKIRLFVSSENMRDKLSRWNSIYS